MVADVAKQISVASGGAVQFQVQKMAGAVTVSRGNVLPYLGLTGLSTHGAEIVAANVQVTSNLKLRGCEGRMLRLVLLHELLHVVGLDHSEDPDSIMFAVLWDSQQSLTEADIAELRWLYAD